MFIAPMSNMVLFDRIVLIQRLTVSVLSGLEAGLSLRTAVAGVAARRALQGVPTVAENMPKLFARSFKIFAGIGLALDVSNIILTSIDIYKCSFSEHGKKLKESADQLQEELEYVEQVHDSLRIEIFLVFFFLYSITAGIRTNWADLCSDYREIHGKKLKEAAYKRS
ncbi:hypothetical protein AVEN_75640-1 [Araneus ventricosus]|uniref:Uncharacterized protein n=1 Tax=Araneus ventricosus TaxID=182803 RepID=A0A4Y2L6P8_ARAVE|nr:hypothetical protein AVEN_75357-1 [Araneus ventricosus]GBN09279.1 hypothetical protein AVEN_75640-1 [Araneus ventricosus]